MNLLAGGKATFVLSGTLSPTATGTLVNTATVTPPPNIVDPNPGNGTSTETNPIFGVPPSPPIVDLAITKVNLGPFTAGQIGAQYGITVKNVGTIPTSGVVTVTDTLPFGLTATAISGAGWACTQPAGPCTRSDPLAPGASYPMLTLTVNIAINAPSPIVNLVNVKGGGDTNGANNDAKSVVTLQPAGGGVEPIPVDSPLALALLACLMLVFGGTRLARRRQD